MNSFPIVIEMSVTGEERLIQHPNLIPRGQAFKVKELNVTCPVCMGDGLDHRCSCHPCEVCQGSA